MIHFEDISFVVQGPVSKPATADCIAELRRWFPGSEIVLSTWDGADVSGLTVDSVVFSADPGACNFMLPESGEVLYNNGNRQILSTKAGLKAASRPFAAKVRSDLLVQGNAWLQHWDRYPRRAQEWRMFRERIIVGNLHTRIPVREVPKPFHPSDWFMFGLREDLLLLWDIDLEPEPQHSLWFRTRPHPAVLKGHPDTRRYQAEQYLWKTLVDRFGAVSFEHLSDATRENIRLTQLTFANNLIILENEHFPLVSPKHGPMRRKGRYCCYTHREWNRLYRHYCCNERLLAAADRLVDLRHWAHGFYYVLPEDVIDYVWKASSTGKHLLKSVRAH